MKISQPGIHKQTHFPFYQNNNGQRNDHLVHTARKNSGLILILSLGIMLQPLCSQAFSTTDRTQTCPVTEQQLSDLADQLHEATSELFAPSNNSLFFSNSALDTFCSVKLSFVQIQASYLLTQFQLLKQDAQMFDNVVKGLELHLSEFNTLVESTKISHLQSLSDFNISTFNINLAALQQQVNSLFTQVKNLHGQKYERAIKLCVGHIRKGEADEAYQIFIGLNDNNALDKITRQAYNQKRNPDNVEEIVAFARILPNCSQDYAVFSALFDEMKKYGNLNNPEILLIHEAIKPCSVPLAQFQSQLLPYVKNVISKWTDNIQKTTTINAFAEGGNFSKSVLRENIPSLVVNALSNKISNLGPVLDFASGLPDFSLSMTAFESVLSEMTKMNKLYSSEVVRLAYKVKEKMEQGTNFMSTEVKRQFANLKKNFPDNVANIIWSGDNCTLRNEGKNNEFLYAAEVFDGNNSQNRRIFTWKSSGQPVESNWAFEAQNDGQSFRIKNTFWNEYMFVGHVLDSEAKWAFVSNDGESKREGLWRILPLTDTTLQIISYHNDEELFASTWRGAHGPNDRGVFAWTASNDVYPVSLWKWTVAC